jgi:hypothetical protein
LEEREKGNNKASKFSLTLALILPFILHTLLKKRMLLSCVKENLIA